MGIQREVPARRFHDIGQPFEGISSARGGTAVGGEPIMTYPQPTPATFSRAADRPAWKRGLRRTVGRRQSVTNQHGKRGWPGRKTDREKEALTIKSSRTKRTWTFRARFRRHAFGWGSEPATKRIKEAVSEIKKAVNEENLLNLGGDDASVT
jgi:hypothetical protein